VLYTWDDKYGSARTDTALHGPWGGYECVVLAICDTLPLCVLYCTLVRGIVIAASRMNHPLLDLLQQQYAPRRLGIAQNTIAQYAVALRSLQRFHGREIAASELSEDLVLPWLSARLTQVAPRTVKRERGDLLTLWRFAAKQALCDAPVDIPAIRVPRKLPVAWTLDEFERLVATCRLLTGELGGTGVPRAAWWTSLQVFLYWSGCRIGAALALRPCDFDLGRRLVRLPCDTAKTDVEQVISIHDQVVAALAGHWSPHRRLVWPYPFRRRQIWVQLKKILRQAGLPSDRYHAFHCVRRTNYTLTVKFGSRDMAQRQLGHRTDMSQHYEDSSQLSIRQAADVLPELGRGNGRPSVDMECGNRGNPAWHIFD